MIYGLIGDLKSDGSVLIHWFKGEDIVLDIDEEKDQRVQLAAFRVLAAVAMAFGAIWALQIITFVVTFPIKVLLQLALAVGFYAGAHDVFIMSKNANQDGFTPKKQKPYLFGLFRGHEVSEEEQARKFTHGTFLQPIWMWLYVKRNKISNSRKK